LAFCIRLSSGLISEPIIHEFDPHFNWHCTQYTDAHGLDEFLGWSDNISWYPRGRPVGETAYPGLMFTSGGLSCCLLQIFDPSYATKDIPIIAFMAEHQPSSGAMYFMDCGYLIIAFPVGCYLILRLGLTEESEGHFLLLIWGMSTFYFASI
jgi:asparagine N-glycosylation enzyme membrane subunit Stt3